MFAGLKSFRDANRVSSYEEACAVLEKASKTPKLGRQREEKRYGFHLGMNRNHGVTWVRKLHERNYEDAIAFRLYDTDVVTWFPDNSVEIDNFGTVTTSDFAGRFLPAGVSLAHVVERRGEIAGHKGVRYRVGERTVTASWDPSYTYTLGEYRLCFAGLFRFRERDGDWLPDEDCLDEVKFPELDQRGAREVAKRFHLRDFETWLSMVPMHLKAGGTTIEHDCWDVDDCAAALEKRDFALASMFLPLVTEPSGFGNFIKPLPIHVGSRDQHVTMSSLRKLKLALWDREGLLSDVAIKTIPCREFDRRMARVRELGALGCNNRHYGPRY